MPGPVAPGAPPVSAHCPVLADTPRALIRSGQQSPTSHLGPVTGTVGGPYLRGEAQSKLAASAGPALRVGDDCG